MDSLSPHITTPVPLPKVCWSGNEVYTPLPLHPYYSIATLEWHCSVNLHICDALQCYIGGTLHYHSNATPERTLHCHSVTTTPMPLSKYTPKPLRSVFGVLICIFSMHSYVTPMPLQYHSKRSEIVHSIDTPNPLYCHSVRVRVMSWRRQNKDVSSNVIDLMFPVYFGNSSRKVNDMMLKGNHSILGKSYYADRWLSVRLWLPR